jgi:hypothetical protein
MERMLRHLAATALLLVAPCALALPCPTDTLEHYIDDIASCEVGDATFSGFATFGPLPAGSVEIVPAQITVVPVDPGLEFVLDPPVLATSNVVRSALFGFNVTSTLGIRAAFASLAGGTASGDGVAEMVVNLCVGDSFDAPFDCTQDPRTLTAVVTADTALNESTQFDTTSEVGVLVNFIVDGGLVGAASLGSGTVRFALREPPAAALVAAALMLLAAFARWRRTLM